VIDDERLYREAKPVKWEKDGKEYDIGGWSAHMFEAQKDKESEATGENAGSGASEDWIQSLELTRAKSFGHDADPPLPPTAPKHKPRVLVLYGSLRPESFSRKLALECARARSHLHSLLSAHACELLLTCLCSRQILDMLGCDIRVYNPRGLPLRDPAIENHPKVQELRALSDWSEGHVWISPEMHGEVTGTFKTQIDWLPLNTGSVRPTQGRSVMIAQVNGGSQSFNVVNSLRKLARWMRMNCVTNQSSVPKAWKEFDERGRMKPSEFRDRVVDVCEEFYKYTLILRPFADFLVDRYSERKEKAEQGRLLTQAEKEKVKDAAAGESKEVLIAQVNEKMNK